MAILKRFNVALSNHSSPPAGMGIQIQVMTEYQEPVVKEVPLYRQDPGCEKAAYLTPATPVPPYTPRFADSPGSLCSFDTATSTPMPGTPLPGFAPTFASDSIPSSAFEEQPAQPKLHLYEFRQVRGVGQGGFGSVYLTKHIPSGSEVALKVIDKRFCNEEATLKEQRVLQALGTQGNRRVLKFLGSFHNPRHYFFVTPFYGGGDLNTELSSWGRKMPLPLVKYRVAELVVATKFIHSRGYVHRDLKLENALIDDDRSLVIADFGLAEYVGLSGSNAYRALKSACGTMEYVSPEMLNEGGDGYTFSVDVWAIGVCAFKLLFGETPWTYGMGDSYSVIHQHVMFGTLDEWLKGRRIDTESRQFLEAVFEHDLSRRPSLDELAKLPFFRDTGIEKMLNDEFVPVPDVGAPPYIGDDGTDEVFFGSFGGGGVYCASGDPSPSFNYIAPSFIPPEDSAEEVTEAVEVVEAVPVPEEAEMPQPLDSFEDIPLEEDLTEKTDGAISPPPMFFGGMTVTVATTVTVVEDAEESPARSVQAAEEVCQTQVAVATKEPSVFARVKSWLGKVASAIGRFLPFAKCH